MKRLLAIAIITLLIFSFALKPVFAAEESGSAATLAFNLTVPDTRVERLKEFLKSYDSPLTDEADVFVSAADTYNIDWKLVAAIAGVESTFGKAIPAGSYNAWGWGIFTGATDGVYFKDWADGIAQVSQGLRQNYIDHGAKNIYDIGWIYAANGDSWGTHVRFFIDKIEAFQQTDPSLLSVSI